MVPLLQLLGLRPGGIEKTKNAIYFHVISFLSCYFYVHVSIFIKFLSGPALLNLLHEQRVLHILNGGT